MNQQQSRIALTVFFVGLVAVTALLTFGLVPRVTSVKAQAHDNIPRWKCLEILTGDLIRVASGEETNLVHVAGIVAPPPVRGSALEQMAMHRAMPVDDLFERAQISRKSLTTWMYRRTVRVTPLPNLTPAHPDALEAYVEISGVDVGKKMLQHGQAYPAELQHERSAAYRTYAEAAEAAGIGLWR